MTIHKQDTQTTKDREEDVNLPARSETIVKIYLNEEIDSNQLSW